MRQQYIQVRESVIHIHISIYNQYRQITPCADFMKSNTINLFLYIYKHLYFLTVEYIEGKNSDHFMIAMKNINTLFQYCGFHIKQANMYCEFEPIRDGLLGIGINLNTLSCDEHVPEAE